MMNDNTKFKKNLLAVSLPAALLVIAGCASNGLEETTAAHKDKTSDTSVSIDTPMVALSFSPSTSEPKIQENTIETESTTSSEEVFVRLSDEVEITEVAIKSIEETKTSSETTPDASPAVTDFAFLIENKEDKPVAIENAELDESDTVEVVEAIAYPQHRVVQFKFDSAEISASDMDKLTEHAFYLRQTPKAILVVSGHADSQGHLLYNQELSEKRAQQVADLLIYMGINPEQIKTQAFGAEQPTGTVTAYKENRRVELSYEEPTLLSSRKK
ncbi:hypothetical protein MNBD_GAMMA16-1306 [hydrothermal vent metagenome]|uniref:OmpA-like domain-containing protein n=1 Tax=hydrothermal vent metagenome TaxID=652676 RepID=A0A3B0YWM6_9ZZZZ